VLKKANGKREKWRKTHDHVLFWPFTFAVDVMLNNREIKVAQNSFLAPMRYLSLFSNHWQLGSQNWQGASSTKKRLYFDMFYWTRYRYHSNTAGSKPALNIGFEIFSENSVVRFFHHLS